MKEERLAGQDTLGIIEGGLEKYKRALKLILEMRMEQLYGGHKDCMKQVRKEAYDDALEIWNEAVEQCLKIVKEL